MGTETSPIALRASEELPTPLIAALNQPLLERKGWQKALAPQLIGLFLWIPFFDQIPQETLSAGGIGWPVLGAALAAWLCYLWLYRPPAMWGMTTGHPLGVLATSTFGTRGATWIPGLLLAGVGVVWLAVATLYATDLCLRGLVLIQLLDRSCLTGSRRRPGPAAERPCFWSHRSSGVMRRRSWDDTSSA